MRDAGRGAGGSAGCGPRGGAGEARGATGDGGGGGRGTGGGEGGEGEGAESVRGGGRGSELGVWGRILEGEHAPEGAMDVQYGEDKAGDERAEDGTWGTYHAVGRGRGVRVLRGGHPAGKLVCAGDGRWYERRAGRGKRRAVWGASDGHTAGKRITNLATSNLFARPRFRLPSHPPLFATVCLYTRHPVPPAASPNDARRSTDAARFSSDEIVPRRTPSHRRTAGVGDAALFRRIRTFGTLLRTRSHAGTSTAA